MEIKRYSIEKHAEEIKIKNKGPFKVGDIVTICETEEDYINLDDDTRRSLSYIYRDHDDLSEAGNPRVKIPFPLKVKCVPVRLNREGGHLCIEWLDALDDTWKVTNIYMLEKAGFKFIHPKFDVIPIMECADDDLDEHDLVIKAIVETAGWTKKTNKSQTKYMVEHAKIMVDNISKIMGKKGIVFYRP